MLREGIERLRKESALLVSVLILAVILAFLDLAREIKDFAETRECLKHHTPRSCAHGHMLDPDTEEFNRLMEAIEPPVEE